MNAKNSRDANNNRRDTYNCGNIRNRSFVNTDEFQQQQKRQQQHERFIQQGGKLLRACITPETAGSTAAGTATWTTTAAACNSRSPSNSWLFL
jgi:uncharacterized membrane protein